MQRDANTHSNVVHVKINCVVFPEQFVTLLNIVGFSVIECTTINRTRKK